MKNGTSRSAWWRSLEERAGDPAALERIGREFAADDPSRLEPASRRTFLKLMSASAALAGMTACRYPQEEILPFARRPEGRVPGVPQHFATAMESSGVVQGLVVTSYDGRPIKIEGNPDHPLNAGATDIRAQASILDLYDPDRSRGPSRAEGDGRATATWADAEAALLDATAPGRRIAVLAESSSSPTRARLRRQLEETRRGVRWFEYEACSRDNERLGARLAFGRPLVPRYDLRSADLVVSLDSDLLSGHPAALRHAREFAERRRAEDGTMNRLVVLESTFSITGAMADHRHPVVATAIATVAAQLAAGVPGGLPRGLAGAQGGPALPFLDALVEELDAHRGHSLVVAGPDQPAEVHALVHLVNERLGNVGRTVRYAPADDPARPAHDASIAELAALLRDGGVDTLVMLGGNPAWDAPADVGFGDALAAAGTSFHLSEYRNETSRSAAWHLNRAHFLETWGDVRGDDGTLTVAQPLIEPLFEGRSPIELLGLVVDRAGRGGRDLVRETARRDGWAASDEQFRSALRDGVVRGTVTPAVPARVDGERLGAALADWSPPPVPGGGELELVLRPDPKLGDGRWANNGWLQELPEPMTKLSWDNALLVAEETAAQLGLTSQETAVVETAAGSVEAPVFVVPGQAPGSVALWLGHGRTAAGRVADGVGVNAYPLKTTGEPAIVTGVSVKPAGRPWPLAAQQDFHAIDTLGLAETLRREPELVREATLDEYRADPEFVKHRVHTPELHDLWEPIDVGKDYKWGMAIDLSACIGCSSCVVACQAENNIPVVGKDEVMLGRDMQWIRVDRYFSGTGANPRVAFQPVTCQHCENAPCEQVCPVAATLHNEEGLNQMVYNRCIGTRYCSNNCPYKVRRFNFWNNQKDTTGLEALRHNPEVTVRSRGVMEKCSFCVQRIEAARATAKLEGRRIAEADVISACAQACPTRAISFGDLKDPSSRVAQDHENPRAYAMLAELKVVPRTKYLARLRNPRDGGGHGGGHGAGHGGKSTDHGAGTGGDSHGAAAAEHP